MSKLTLTEAVKAIPASEATLRRYIRKGKITFETNAKGRKFFDPAELQRVFGKTDGEDTARISPLPVRDPESINENQNLSPVSVTENQNLSRYDSLRIYQPHRHSDYVVEGLLLDDEGDIIETDKLTTFASIYDAEEYLEGIITGGSWIATVKRHQHLNMNRYDDVKVVVRGISRNVVSAVTCDETGTIQRYFAIQSFDSREHAHQFARKVSGQTTVETH